MPDEIHIEQLELSGHIGVPDAERAEPQRLTVNLTLIPQRALSELGDDLANTIDYFAVSRAVQKLAAARPRKLIETLGEEITTLVLNEFPVARVDLELRKFILPDTAYVAIRLSRTA
jgi:FolB domain-containing protein